MGSRRESRECALQMLYQMDLTGCSAEETKAAFWGRTRGSGTPGSGTPFPPEIQNFANQLLEGVVENERQIDEQIAVCSTHWKVHRMPSIDKNILRLSVYELLYCREIPVRVTLNEAIEIAKKFGTEESGSFINGVLDKIAKSVRPDESADS